MEDVRKVYTTKEVADQLDISPSYLIRVVKQLEDYGYFTEKDFRKVGKRAYLYNDKAVREIMKKLNK